MPSSIYMLFLIIIRMNLVYLIFAYPLTKAEGSTVCLPCQRGHYCSNDATSQEAMLSHMVCPAGLLCSQGLDREPQRSSTLCPKGFYCPGGSVVSFPIAMVLISLL